VAGPSAIDRPPSDAAPIGAAEVAKVVTKKGASGGAARFVYVLVRPRSCKIGISVSALQRARGIASQAGLTDLSLRVAFPVVASLAREIEQEAHRLVASSRIAGEWFDLTPEKAIDAVERAILSVTRKHAVGPHELTKGLRRALDLRTPEGQQIFRSRLERMSREADNAHR
jgi:hypothetical protein